ncbi:hypothetical protein ACVIGB_006617 [Bradyrhizobium sp. USDA 4341]
MRENLNTLEGCRAFAQRLHDDARDGFVIMTATEFVRAVEIGLIEYTTQQGVSLAGQFIGEYAPHVAGNRVRLADAA